MKAEISVTSEDVATIKRMLVNYRQSLKDLGESSPTRTAYDIHDNLLADEQGRADSMIKRLSVLPEEQKL